MEHVGSRYSGRSGGTRMGTVGSPRSGISDTYFNGGYGFTRKSFFKNSENIRSQFKNSFAKRSYFGNRYDRFSRLRADQTRIFPAGRPMPAAPHLDIWQPMGDRGPGLPPPQQMLVVPPTKPSPLLGGSEIENRVSGCRLLFNTPELSAVEAVLRADGTAAFRLEAENDAEADWWVADNSLCLGPRDGGPPVCRTVALAGDALRFFWGSGAPAGMAEILEEKALN